MNMIQFDIPITSNTQVVLMINPRTDQSNNYQIHVHVYITYVLDRLLCSYNTKCINTIHTYPHISTNMLYQ